MVNVRLEKGPEWSKIINVMSKELNDNKADQTFDGLGAAIARWIFLHLPSCRPGSNHKHTIYAFLIFHL